MRKKLITIVTLTAILLSPTNIFAKDFTDVKKGDWFYEAVSELTDAGIINGYQDNTFKPSRKVSYAEFLTLLNNTLGVKQAPDNKNPREWYNPTLNELKSKGVITEKIANPNAEISRNEMAKYLSLGLEKLKNQKLNKAEPTTIKDFANIPNEYKDFVASVVNAGLIKGDEKQNFNGEKSLTRAETAIIIKGLGGETTPTQDEKPVVQVKGYPPMEGKDKYGKPYKIQQAIVDKYPENRNPNLSGANAYQPIVNLEMLKEYGQDYLDIINSIITNLEYPRYGAYEKWAPSLIDRNTKSYLDGLRLEEEARKNGLTPLSDIDFENMTEEELKDYL